MFEDQDWIKNKSEELHIAPEIYLKIVKSTITDGQSDIECLSSSLEEGALDQVHLKAHKLKGVFSNLRITEISDPAKGIDQLSKSNGEKVEMERLLNELKTAFNNLKKHLS